MSPTGSARARPVSYTHLDVYKRQAPARRMPRKASAHRAGNLSTEKNTSYPTPSPLLRKKCMFPVLWRLPHTGLEGNGSPQPDRRQRLAACPLPRSEDAVPGVAEAGDDVAVLVEMGVDGGRINVHVGMRFLDALDAFGSAQDVYKRQIPMNWATSSRPGSWGRMPAASTLRKMIPPCVTISSPALARPPRPPRNNARNGVSNSPSPIGAGPQCAQRRQAATPSLFSLCGEAIPCRDGVPEWRSAALLL